MIAVGHWATMLLVEASSVSSNGSALPISGIGLVMKRGRIYSTTSSGFITHKYVVESPGKT